MLKEVKSSSNPSLDCSWNEVSVAAQFLNQQNNPDVGDAAKHLPSPDKLPSACELRSAETKVKKKKNGRSIIFGEMSYVNEVEPQHLVYIPE